MDISKEIDKILFRETQQFRQIWLWATLLLVNLVVIGLFFFRFLDQPATDSAQVANSGQLFSMGYVLIKILAILFSVGLICLFYVMNLITEVREDGLYVKFFPLTRQKKIEFKDIATCNERIYRPIREYGGWGIRYGRKGKAYNVSGNRGVQLEFVQGKPLLIGSQKASELAKAINSKR